MGFKSVMKKVGKVALKVAPYAAMAIPGVGIPLGMAIAGATKAADTKVSGGTWKQALLSGGIAAGTGALGGAGGVASKAAGKIGPSSSLLSKLGAGAIGKSAGTGIAGKIGGQLGTMGLQAATGALTGMGGKNTTNPASYPGAGSPTGAGGNAGPTGGSLYGGPKGSLVGDFVSTGKGGIGPSNIPGSVMPRGGFSYRDAPLNQYDQSNPNLALALHQGRQTAIKNQPFRAGYDVNTMVNNDDPENPVVTTARMPPIYSGAGGGRRRQQGQSGY